MSVAVPVIGIGPFPGTRQLTLSERRNPYAIAYVACSIGYGIENRAD
jgi:hypothetical protein